MTEMTIREKNKKLRLGGLVSLAAIAALMTGCVAAPPPTTSAAPADPADTSAPTVATETTASDTLNVAFNVAPTSLDPAISCTLDDSRFLYQLYVQPFKHGVTTLPDGSTEVDPTVTEPYFFESYKVSEDGLVWDFKLKEGWKFPSGEPMNAEAVKYSFERVNRMNSCGIAILNDLYTDPVLMKEIEVIDDYNLRITLSVADGDFLLAMASTSSSIVDPSVVEAHGGVVDNEHNEWLDSNDAGSGPFRLTSYEPGTSAVLERWEDFPGEEKAASKTINISYVKSEATMLLQLEEGTIDLAYGLSKTAAKSLENKEGLKVIASTATANMQMLMPNDREPWNNVKVREAVTYAIPYQDILDNVLMGYGTLYYGPIQPTMAGYSEANSAPRTYDLEKAKALIAESGLATPAKVKLEIISGDTTQTSIATILESALKEIGIELEVTPLSEAAWGEDVYGLTAPSALRLDGPAVFSPGYYLQYDEDCASIEKGWNTGVICIEENSALLAKARAAKDTTERDAALAELTKNWVAQSPKVILYLDATAVAMKSNFQYHWNMETNMISWALT
jgi:peptide/nickel transport system substrate-binding protein